MKSAVKFMLVLQKSIDIYDEYWYNVDTVFAVKPEYIAHNIINNGKSCGLAGRKDKLQ